MAMMKKYDDIDYIEYGDSGLIPMPDGWYYDKRNDYTIDPNGVVYDREGNIFYDPTEEDEYRFEVEEYDWF